jgi:hypothetical protein
MRALALARSHGGASTHARTASSGDTVVDLCEGCRALWFDAFESVTLTPDAIRALFREVSRICGTPARPLPASLRCPRCRSTLSATQDLRHSTRFTYWRCPKSHGRFTPFVQFLREKDLVRPLTRAELSRLKSHIAQVRCTGCGAPVDLAREMVCGFCRAPLEVLDPDAVAKALAALDRAQAARGKVDVDALAAAIIQGHRSPQGVMHGSQATDLVGAGMALVLSVFDR